MDFYHSAPGTHRKLQNVLDTCIRESQQAVYLEIQKSYADAFDVWQNIQTRIREDLRGINTRHMSSDNLEIYNSIKDIESQSFIRCESLINKLTSSAPADPVNTNTGRRHSSTAATAQQSTSSLQYPAKKKPMYGNTGSMGHTSHTNEPFATQSADDVVIGDNKAMIGPRGSIHVSPLDPGRKYSFDNLPTRQRPNTSPELYRKPNVPRKPENLTSPPNSSEPRRHSETPVSPDMYTIQDSTLAVPSGALDTQKKQLAEEISTLKPITSASSAERQPQHLSKTLSGSPMPPMPPYAASVSPSGAGIDQRSIQPHYSQPHLLPTQPPQPPQPPPPPVPPLSRSVSNGSPKDSPKRSETTGFSPLRSPDLDQYTPPTHYEPIFGSIAARPTRNVLRSSVYPTASSEAPIPSVSAPPPSTGLDSSMPPRRPSGSSNSLSNPLKSNVSSAPVYSQRYQWMSDELQQNHQNYQNPQRQKSNQQASERSKLSSPPHRYAAVPAVHSTPSLPVSTAKSTEHPSPLSNPVGLVSSPPPAAPRPPVPQTTANMGKSGTPTAFSAQKGTVEFASEKPASTASPTVSTEVHSKPVIASGPAKPPVPTAPPLPKKENLAKPPQPSSATVAATIASAKSTPPTKPSAVQTAQSGTSQSTINPPLAVQKTSPSFPASPPQSASVSAPPVPSPGPSTIPPVPRTINILEKIEPITFGSSDEEEDEDEDEDESSEESSETEDTRLAFQAATLSGQTGHLGVPETSQQAKPSLSISHSELDDVIRSERGKPVRKTSDVAITVDKTSSGVGSDILRTSSVVSAEERLRKPSESHLKRPLLASKVAGGASSAPSIPVAVRTPQPHETADISSENAPRRQFLSTLRGTDMKSKNRVKHKHKKHSGLEVPATYNKTLLPNYNLRTQSASSPGTTRRSLDASATSAPVSVGGSFAGGATPVSRIVSKPVVRTPVKPVKPVKPVVRQTVKPVAKPAVKPAAKPVVRSVAKPVAKPITKTPVKHIVKPVVKPVVKATPKLVVKPPPKVAVKPAVRQIKPSAKPALKPAASTSAASLPSRVVKPKVSRESSPVSSAGKATGSGSTSGLDVTRQSVNKDNIRSESNKSVRSAQSQLKAPPNTGRTSSLKAASPTLSRKSSPAMASDREESNGSFSSDKAAVTNSDNETSQKTPVVPVEPEVLDPITEFNKKAAEIIPTLNIDPAAAEQILQDVVIHGDDVYWSDIAGLEEAKNSLKEAVVYPFLRPDLFLGLREPIRGMLLFGPPGTGKTMLARAVATESKSTFFAISSSSLMSKWMGESEKLVRALFGLAKAFAPSIIFVDEIDSIMSARGDNEHETTRRVKTEFLVQWSELSRAAAGREGSSQDNRVLVLAATNLPWAIDEAARRRFPRRQYIPLPEPETREVQLRNLLRHQHHELSDDEFAELIKLTEGFSGSDLTALAKDAAMGPIRELGENLLVVQTEFIRAIQFKDFQNSLKHIRASVGPENLKQFEDWAKQYGSSGA